MSRLIFLLLMILPPVFSYGQRKYPPPSAYAKRPNKADDDCAKKADQCLNSHKYTAKQRRAFYPFNIGGSIRLISYESRTTGPKDILVDRLGETEEYNPDFVFTAIKPNEFVVDYARVIEYKDLSKVAIDSLTDILFNVDYKPIQCNIYTENPGASCYEPRNAVVFLDKKGKVKQYLEICFGCQRHYYSSRKFKEVAYCDGKYDMLRNFFAGQGLAYGTKKHGLTDE